MYECRSVLSVKNLTSLRRNSGIRMYIFKSFDNVKCPCLALGLGKDIGSKLVSDWLRCTPPMFIPVVGLVIKKAMARQATSLSYRPCF